MVMIGSTAQSVAQIVDQLPQLRRAFDVAPEKNESAGLDLAEKRGGFGIEFGSGHASEEQLTEHGVGSFMEGGELRIFAKTIIPRLNCAAVAEKNRRLRRDFRSDSLRAFDSGARSVGKTRAR